MILATFSSAHFDFVALAETEAEAADALLLAWTRHVEQTGAEPCMMAEAIDDGDVNFTPIHVGAVLRDGSPL